MRGNRGYGNVEGKSAQLSFRGGLKPNSDIGRLLKRMLGEEVRPFEKNVKLAVDQACKGSKGREEGKEGVANCIVQWGFRVAAGEEVVPQSITGFGTMATGGSKLA